MDTMTEVVYGGLVSFSVMGFENAFSGYTMIY